MKNNPVSPYLKLAWTITMVVLVTTMLLSAACTAAAPASVKPDKNAPVIHFIVAEKQVKPSSTSKVKCMASSKQADVLSYKWSATGGEIQGEGDSIIWVAPGTAGDYALTVLVISNKGSQTSGWVNINVSTKNSQYPMVTSMICADCRYGDGVEASRWKQYSILCQAEDPDGDQLTYQWFATTGEIKDDESPGGGFMATWRTADQPGNALIKVIVTDKDGNQTEGYLSVNISCCH